MTGSKILHNVFLFHVDNIRFFEGRIQSGSLSHGEQRFHKLQVLIMLPNILKQGKNSLTFNQSIKSKDPRDGNEKPLGSGIGHWPSIVFQRK
jgi:hypothetical protein